MVTLVACEQILSKNQYKLLRGLEEKVHIRFKIKFSYLSTLRIIVKLRFGKFV